MSINVHHWLCGFSAALVAVSMARGQTAQSPPASTQPSDAMAADSDSMMDQADRGSGALEESVLSGPEVSSSAMRTLVRLDASQRFVRVEGRPDEAAVMLLELDPDRREQARQVAAARRETMRTFLLANLELVVESTDAIEAKDNQKAQRIQRQMYDRFDPAHLRDPLAERLAEVLSAEESAQLTQLTDEYWNAWLDWEMRNAKDKSDSARERTQSRLLNDLFQQELRQAYERTLRPYRAKFESIVRAVDPTDEQKAAIREIIHQYIQAGGLEPTTQQQQEAARKIYQALDEERRMKLFEAAFTRL